jgi:ATP-dependent HslUV protease subunit HslV
VTTVAYRDGVLAGDGRITLEGGSIQTENQRKVHRLRDGRLFGYAGDTDDAERLRISLLQNDKPPSLQNIQALLVQTDGSIDYYQGNVWQRLEGDDYYAIGTGGPSALVAMDCGKSAREAVVCAIRRDNNSGGKIKTVRLKAQ